MYIRVDESEHMLEGFSYINQDGEVEKVKFFDNNIVEIIDGGRSIFTYVKDIPKLIKALQAVRKHLEGKLNET